MYKHPRVQILLSTYNGEKYIREQLNSIIQLKGTENISVLIRDDGSTDDTKSILEEFAEKYGMKVIYGENKGINGSYNELIKCADYSCDYYAMSDQDDVWLPNKISKAIYQISEVSDRNIPILYGSRVEIVDKNLSHIGNSPMYKKAASFYNALTQNIFFGHTIVMNKSLLKQIREIPKDNIIVADWWIYLVGSGIGHVIFDKIVSVKHRQHRANAIGFNNNFFKNIMSRIKQYDSRYRNQISVQMQVFYERYNGFLSDNYRSEIELFLRSLNTIYDRIKYIINCKVYRQSTFDNLIFKCMYIIGKYNLENKVE